MTNPLLSDWNTPFALPPFDAIKDSDFAPAVDVALAEARANIAALAENPEPASFANTIEALETAEEKLGKVLSVFYNLSGADSTDTRQALERDLAPKLSAFSTEITMNPALFARIAAVWEQRDSLRLTPEQARVLMLTRRGFVRAGAKLTGADRDRLCTCGSAMAGAARPASGPDLRRQDARPDRHRLRRHHHGHPGHGGGGSARRRSRHPARRRGRHRARRESLNDAAIPGHPRVPQGTHA